MLAMLSLHWRTMVGAVNLEVGVVTHQLDRSYFLPLFSAPDGFYFKEKSAQTKLHVF